MPSERRSPLFRALGLFEGNLSSGGLKIRNMIHLEDEEREIRTEIKKYVRNKFDYGLQKAHKKK